MKPILSFANSYRVQSLARLASLAAAVLVIAMASVASAQQSFRTADEAVDALVGAVRMGDRASILTVLGREGADIVSSGDDAADAAERQRFLAAYDAKHQVIMDGDSKAMIIVGQEDFPFPIPLVRKDRMWRFDTAAGRLEILYRRIGRNELDTIQACLAYVDAASSSLRQRARATVLRRAHTVPRLLLQENHEAGTDRARRRSRLHRSRQDDWRLRARGLSGPIWNFGCDDISNQPY
jgi:Protein of unknown function (DUF2950)